MHLRFAVDESKEVAQRVAELRKRLWMGLCEWVEGVRFNGPPLESEMRLSGNVNCMLAEIEGEAWMAACPDVAFSSGSACSSVDAKPSHVLTGLGLDESQARRSVRFGIGKFNTPEQIDRAIELLAAGYRGLKPN